ncbi:hypothetical protein J5226_07240 [Lysobacter sp. K5869]|uniref:hypothetical protein n=1 Tax=Lysobacter sp. K5869 TaxID=2820808 RepID=UPI001C060D67|nr:hypothetical protein [Lysobacter sp. K5869]QWP78183.1 hypothetical protein J5226_07240 [Lysobacter sp. K5869]
MSALMARRERADSVLAQELGPQLSQFSVSKGDQEVGTLELINHGGPVGATRDFKSRRSADQVAADYSKQLEEYGWKVVESHTDSRHPLFVRFCKGVTGVDLTIWQKAGEASYRIALLRNGKDGGKAYCQIAP